MTDLEKKFSEYKAQYGSHPENSDELIELMQENLKKRTDKSDVNVADGSTLSIETSNIEELYKIDATLRNENIQKEMRDLSKKMTSRNKYTKDHPYNG